MDHARQLLTGEIAPRAIGSGVMLEFERRGLQLPKDLSAIGFDDLYWSRHLRSALTTLHVPNDVTWRGAREYLLARMEGHKLPKYYKIDYSLVVRESTSVQACPTGVFALNRYERTAHNSVNHTTENSALSSLGYRDKDGADVLRENGFALSLLSGPPPPWAK